jgi:hypothetical protein
MTEQQYLTRRPEDLDPSIPEDDAIRIGALAARETKRNPKFIYELELGRGLLVGRRKVQQQLGVNRINGKDYSTAFDQWLSDQPGLKEAAAVDPHVRSAAMWCVENWPDVLTHIKGLNYYQKQRMTARGIMAVLKPKLEGKPKAPRKTKPTPPASADSKAGPDGASKASASIMTSISQKEKEFLEQVGPVAKRLWAGAENPNRSDAIEHAGQCVAEINGLWAQLNRGTFH